MDLKLDIINKFHFQQYAYYIYFIDTYNYSITREFKCNKLMYYDTIELRLILIFK